jgi:hypothetical protein
MRAPAAGLILAVAFAAACGSSGKPVDLADADGNDAGADAPPDTPIETSADAPSPLVSFVFTNSTAHAIYIQTSGFSTQGYWSLVQGGTRLPVDNTCEVCDCRGCPSCAVCGRALARVTELAPGAQHRWTWDGRIWESVPNGCSATLACEQDQVIPAGAALGVTVTYSASFAVDTSFGADDQFIGTPLTATAAFTNAPGASIAITATQ